MDFTNEEKKCLLQAFTDILKDANGKGPRNIYVKYFPNEIHIVMQGVVSHFEKYLIREFGQEAIDCLVYFYEKSSYKVESILCNSLRKDIQVTFYELDSDFINDLFVYKMKINDGWVKGKVEQAYLANS